MEFFLIQKAKVEELDYDPSEGLELGRLRVIGLGRLNHLFRNGFYLRQNNFPSSTPTVHHLLGLQKIS